jgi:hypothetical protein
LPLSLSTSVCGFGLKAHIEILPTFGEESVKESFFVICIESEQKIVRVLTSDVAIVDDLWTVTGARDAAGKELRPIKGGIRSCTEDRRAMAVRCNSPKGHFQEQLDLAEHGRPRVQEPGC